MPPMCRRPARDLKVRFVMVHSCSIYSLSAMLQNVNLCIVLISIYQIPVYSLVG